VDDYVLLVGLLTSISTFKYTFPKIQWYSYLNSLVTVAGTVEALNFIPCYSLYVNQHKNYSIFEITNQVKNGYF